MDPTYEPVATETKTIYGLQLEQKRNTAVIDRSLFTNIVTDAKQVCVPDCHLI